MQTESLGVPLNIGRLVSDAVWEFRKETAFEVEAEVDKVLIDTGLKERVHLEEGYKQQKFTTNDLSAAIKELLSRARRIAEERGRATISATLIEEVMKIHCPFYPWC